MKYELEKLFIKRNDEDVIELVLTNLKTNAFYKFILKPMNLLCSVELKSYSYRDRECGLTYNQKFIGYISMEHIAFVPYATGKKLQKAVDVFMWFMKHYHNDEKAFILPDNLGVNALIINVCR